MQASRRFIGNHISAHNVAAKKRLRLKEIGVYNLFALTSPEIEGMVDHSNMHSVTMWNAFGGDDHPGATIIARHRSGQ
jgi:hypothetical protein